MHYWYIPGDFTRDLWTALKDEMSAIEYYTKLATLAPDPIRRGTILMIRRDEEAHAIKLSKLLTYLTGQPPHEHKGAVPPIDNFMTGISEAINDEHEAIEFYGALMTKAPSSDIYYTIADIQKDEKLHAELLELLKIR